MNTILVNAMGGNSAFGHKKDSSGNTILYYSGRNRYHKPDNVCECSPEVLVVFMGKLKYIFDVASQTLKVEPQGHCINGIPL